MKILRNFILLFIVIAISCLSTFIYHDEINDYVFKKDIYRGSAEYKYKEVSSSKYLFDDSPKNNGYIFIYLPANHTITVNYEGKILKQIPSYHNNKLYKIILSKLDGNYEFNGYNKNGKQLFNEKCSVSGLTDIIFTESSSLVNFDTNTHIYTLAKELYTQSKSDKDFVYNVTNYVNENIKYSTENLIKTNYIVDLENILLRKYGVCTDLATLECAILRLQNIPCKLIYGQKDGSYHAWCEVLIDNYWTIVDATNNTIGASSTQYKTEYIY